VSARATRSAVALAICVTPAIHDDRLAELDGADDMRRSSVQSW